MELLKDFLGSGRDLRLPVQLCGEDSVVTDEARLRDIIQQKYLLFTYRSGFLTPLPRSTLLSDKGWGCLIRTSQMMLARALHIHCKGGVELKWFCDVDKDTAFFSIHNFVRSISIPNVPFEPKFWSPKKGCEAIRKTVTLSGLNLSVLVFEQELNAGELMQSVGEANPTLLLINVRTTGEERINADIFKNIYLLMSSPSCLGIVCGVPKRSFYYIGVDGWPLKPNNAAPTRGPTTPPPSTDAAAPPPAPTFQLPPIDSLSKDELQHLRLVYLDPHISTLPALLQEEQRPSTIPDVKLPTVEWKRTDSCMAIGFYLRSAQEAAALLQFIWDHERRPGWFLHCPGGAQRPVTNRSDTETMAQVTSYAEFSGTMEDKAASGSSSAPSTNSPAPARSVKSPPTASPPAHADDDEWDMVD